MHAPLDIVIAGHVALDTVIHLDGGERIVHKVSTGGAVTFASLAIKTSNPSCNVGLATKVGHDFPAELLGPFSSLGVAIDGILRDHHAPTTRFELVYDGPVRTVACPARCSPLRVDEFPDGVLAAKRLHLGPLCREMDRRFVEDLGSASDGATIVGVDLQGFIRNVHDDGHITFVPAEEGLAMVSLLHDTFGRKLVIKGDDAECNAVMPGARPGLDPGEIMSFFLESFPRATVLVTSGRKGSIAGMNEDGNPVVARIPAFRPRVIIDETGAGDTFLGSFLARLHGPPATIHACEQAALYASAASSFLVEEPGYKGLKPVPEIEARVASKQFFNA